MRCVRLGICKEWGVQESREMRKSRHLQGMVCAGESLDMHKGEHLRGIGCAGES